MQIMLILKDQEAIIMNFLQTILLLANNRVQMTQGAFVISNGDRSKNSNPYKSGYYKYSDNCVLRINAAQSDANYTVWGEWNPNG